MSGETSARAGDRSGDAPRERILVRIRGSLARRDTVEHPGAFGGWRPADPAGASTPLDAFERLFRSVGGEAARVADVDSAAAWISSFAEEFATVTVGRGVPAALRPARPEAPPDIAALAISMARGAVAETGSLLLDARDGRRTQLLAPTHVVVVPEGTMHPTLVDALRVLRVDLPSSVGLHSGPSKSADIGQVMVRGVHGPGRVVALLVTGDVTA